MANFNNLALTVRGVKALMEAQMGTPLTLSKIGLGSGNPASSVSVTELVAPELMLPISETRKNNDTGLLTIVAKMTNEDIEEGFYWRETGLFFENEEGNDVLFAYAYVDKQYDYVPAYSDKRYVKHIRIANIVTDSADIAVKEQQGLLYVDVLTFDEFKDEFEAHTDNKNNPHGVTIKQIGAAPAGYGLGDWATNVTDFNEAVTTGWYSTANTSTLNAPFGYCVVQTIKRNNDQIIQIAYDTSESASSLHQSGSSAVRIFAGGVWGQWEYANPPMQLGVEYRTTERWQGKVVYKKADPNGNVLYRLEGETEWKSYSELVDAVPSSGGTMTGPLVLKTDGENTAELSTDDESMVVDNNLKVKGSGTRSGLILDNGGDSVAEIVRTPTQLTLQKYYFYPGRDYLYPSTYYACLNIKDGNGQTNPGRALTFSQESENSYVGESAIFGEHNKPSGSFTGTGLKRQVFIGINYASETPKNIGDCLLIYDDRNHFYLVGKYGGVVIGEDSTDSTLALSSFVDGILNLPANTRYESDGDASMNVEGYKYYYQVL